MIFNNQGFPAQSLNNISKTPYITNVYFEITTLCYRIKKVEVHYFLSTLQ